MISHSLQFLAGVAGAVVLIGAGVAFGRARPPLKRLAAEWQQGRDDTIGEACHRVEERGMVLRLSPAGVAAWCDAGSTWDIDGAYASLGVDTPPLELDAGPGRYPDGREFPTRPGVVNAELAALADPPEGAESESDGLAPSPYPNGRLTPAQRRRDRHKRRGAYAEGDVPGPPTDIGQWWADELAALLRDGQSEWFTERMTEAAS